MTLHDFKPWCTNRVLFAHGAPCERCRGGRHWRAATTGCVQRSHVKSLVGAVEAYAHDRRRAYAPVRRWIAPSRFVRDKAVSLGAEAAKVRLLLHAVEPAAPHGGPAELPARFVLFAGRLVEEKGVRLLPALARALAPVPLLVAGEGPLAGWLGERAGGQLRLLGHLGSSELAAVRTRASAVVVPSLFPETFGYAVAEAQLEGRVVVASRIGALGELIEHEANGLLAPPGDAAALAQAVRRALEDAAAPRWAQVARERAARLYEPRTHVAGLVAIYAEAAGG
jgi:glycosyltransferase involved in cell wall biosynthesis